MLAIAIALLFTLAGIAAVVVIADSVLKACHAYKRLMAEAAVLQAGFAVQVGAQEMRVRRSPARTMPDRRLALRPMPTVPACAVA